MKVICPKCKGEIEKNNFNVSTDIAYCDECDKKFTLSELIGDKEIDTNVIMTPPRGTFLKEDYDGSFTVGAGFPKLILFFLIPFACLWSGGSMYGIYIAPLMKKEHLDTAEMLFGLPFLFGTVILLSVILFIMFGKLAVSGNSYEGCVSYGVGPFAWKRNFEVSDIRNVTINLTDVRVNNRRQTGIILHGKKKITFGTLLKQDKKEYIAAVLKQRLVK